MPHGDFSLPVLLVDAESRMSGRPGLGSAQPALGRPKSILISLRRPSSKSLRRSDWVLEGTKSPKKADCLDAHVRRCDSLKDFAH